MATDLEVMASTHIRHEIDGMLVEVPPPVLPWRIGESALLHLRLVSRFLAPPPTTRPDDVYARDYMPTGWSAPTIEDLLGVGGIGEINKRVAHLTRRRLTDSVADGWLAMLQRIPTVASAFVAFVAATAPNYQAAFADSVRLIAEWRNAEAARRR